MFSKYDQANKQQLLLAEKRNTFPYSHLVTREPGLLIVWCLKCSCLQGSIAIYLFSNSKYLVGYLVSNKPLLALSFLAISIKLDKYVYKYKILHLLFQYIFLATFNI